MTEKPIATLLAEAERMGITVSKERAREKADPQWVIRATHIGAGVELVYAELSRRLEEVAEALEGDAF